MGFHRADNQPTTFVPMSAVDAVRGVIADRQVRSYSEVAKGYTYFAEGDVLFAKITPCMQNGKHAIAEGLIDGVGFASTEFHVIRPGPQLDARWVHAFLRQPSILMEATNYFTGAVGQQRVPDDFLRGLQIPIPRIGDQRRIAARLRNRLAVVERARAAAEARDSAANQLLAAYLREVFDGPQAKTWPKCKLGNMLKHRREVVHPRDKPVGQAVFVGLEHIESGTGRQIGSENIYKQELTGRKPQFYQGDIVYGYLRPYLNKVWVARFDGLCSVDQYVYIVNHEKADAEFIAWFMRSPVYLERAPTGFSPGQLPRIRTEEVAATIINLPSADEQRAVTGEIARKIQGILGITEKVQQEVAAINALPAAFLRTAFNGEL